MENAINIFYGHGAARFVWVLYHNVKDGPVV